MVSLTVLPTPWVPSLFGSQCRPRNHASYGTAALHLTRWHVNSVTAVGFYRNICPPPTGANAVQETMPCDFVTTGDGGIEEYH